MRRILVASALVGSLAALALAEEEETGPPTLAELTSRAAQLQQVIRRTQSRDARKRLLEQLEEVRHQMGPTDAAGKRVRCQAMWHDRALEHLDREIKRLSGGETSGPADARTLVRRGRLQVRRMARACLTHGWRLRDGPEKYQVDVFGCYLVNNMRVLDGFFQRLVAVRMPPAGDESAEDEGAGLRRRIRTGLETMTQAADALTAAASSEPETLVPPLATFVEGLEAVREAVEGLEAAKPDAAAAEGEEPGAEQETDEPPAMTGAEKRRIEAIRQAAASLTEPAWTDVGRYLERFAAMIEAGFSVASARAKARELLAETERAATLARSLADSRAAPAEYVVERRRRLVACLEQMASPSSRADAYAWLASLWREDGLRRRVEGLGLAESTTRGLVHAYYVQRVGLLKSETSSALVQGARIGSACSTVVRTLEKMRTWPPEGMSPLLQRHYDRQAEVFLDSVDVAGVSALGDAEQALAALRTAADRAGDLALIVRAETVVQAVRRYRPQQAGAMSRSVTQAAQALVLNPDGAEEPRQRLRRLVGPFEDLETFPAPDPAHQRTLTRLFGRAYLAAVTKLTHDLGAAINAAAEGNPVPLARTMWAKGLFELARKRAAAEQATLSRAPVANLVAFSMPAEVWAAFCKVLDRHLQKMFSQYVQESEERDWRTTPEALEAVYGPVLAAQRLTLDERLPGELPLDRVLRHLRRSAVSDPPETARMGWVVGYHAIEAATTTLADLDGVAQWHRQRMRQERQHLDRVDLAGEGTTTPAD